MGSALQRGIDAAKAGQMSQALKHLKDAIVEEPENASVWVWLAAIIEDEDKQTIFLRKALELDPGNRPAQRGLAFIQRKKYTPPRPGERLSDYTHPVGTFKASVPPIPAGQVNFGVPEQVIIQQVPVPEPVPVPVRAASPGWEIALYALALVVFIVIGFLVGNTLKYINFKFSDLLQPVSVPAKTQADAPAAPAATDAPAVPTIPVPAAGVPTKDGVYLINGKVYQEMKLYLNAPTSEDGMPDAGSGQVSIMVKTLAAMDAAKLRLINAEGKDLLFKSSAGPNGSQIIQSEDQLSPGKYCLVNILNPELKESLYWCLKVK